ncbi:BTAD domain-containing putative transcriptional regulator [Kitasatospora sp. NPDC048365]|uniref:BTAD domain-containing putative transcriptional regulator n=1 Tax=Kitasatospora sp. NPDC048365 TaxID=3364050 RepID=UPI003721DC10
MVGTRGDAVVEHAPAAQVTLGERLQALRRRAGLSQEAAAARAGVSTRALRDLERDRVRQPRAATVRRLADALDLSEDDLAGLRDAVRGRAPHSTGGPRVLVLGPLALRRGTATVPVTGPMLGRLLGLLALKHPEPAGMQEITDILWPTGPPGSWQSLIHTYVSQVRRLLAPAGPTVTRTPTGYLLQASPHLIDLGRFDALLTRATGGHPAPEAAYESLTRALREWRGPVLADADPALRRHPAAVAADERRIRAALLHADTALRLRRPAEAVPFLSDLVHAEPLHESLHARLILALAGGGEQAAALAVFTRLRDRLDEDLGIAPGPEVRDAHLRVLRGRLPRAGRPAPTGPVPAQLPAGVGTHVGREEELQVLDTLVSPDPARRPRLVAVVGAPGIGKTALVTHWAHARRGHFADGQLFADLRGHSRLPAPRPDEVLARFLRALDTPPDRIPADPDEAGALYRTLLADRRTLIVLDDARDADQVRPLLPGSPSCAVVVTSRNRLAGLVAAEGARRIGLDVLAPDEALQLLGSIVGGCRVAAEQEATHRLLRSFGGLPLAIRIAGANLVARNADLAAYSAELTGDDLISRLRVEGDRRSALQEAFDLSYSALPADARRMFRLLALLPGPDLTPAGAAVLAGTTPDRAAVLLAGLADAHLLREHPGGRFDLPDLLRRYARDLPARDLPAEA